MLAVASGDPDVRSQGRGGDAIGEHTGDDENEASVHLGAAQQAEDLRDTL